MNLKTYTWKDTIACTTVLLAMLVGTLSGAYVVYTESASVAIASIPVQA